MQIFYVPNITGNEIVLDETESKHAIRVMRLTKGDKVQLVDGVGGLYEAGIMDANPKKCRLSVIQTEKNYQKSNFHLHIAIAPTKNNDRFEWFLEKATEIGIGEITPVITEHSERKKVNNDRFEKILVSAMKQSVKAFLPKLNDAVSFKSFLETVNAKQKYIAFCGDIQKNHLKNVVKEQKDTVILIGPEGDFSLNEVQLAIAKGFEVVSLGTARLRTETAGLVACHILNLINE